MLKFFLGFMIGINVLNIAVQISALVKEESTKQCQPVGKVEVTR